MPKHMDEPSLPQVPPVLLLPDPAGVLVVVAPLLIQDAECVALENVLSPDERLRASRFPERLRRRYVAGRGRLRLLLARLLDDRPGAITLDYGRWGKPVLAGAFAGRLHFNLTHSQDEALIAFSRTNPVGIDLEMLAPAYTVEWSIRMAASILCDAELSEWQQLPDGNKPGMLLEAWVAKEAVLKAIGCGIAGGMLRVCLPMPIKLPSLFSSPWRRMPIVLDLPPHNDTPGGTVAVNSLDVAPRACAAVACINSLSAVSITTFDSLAGPTSGAVSHGRSQFAEKSRG
jgi:phosphopantetheinyl transferase